MLTSLTMVQVLRWVVLGLRRHREQELDAEVLAGVGPGPSS